MSHSRIAVTLSLVLLITFRVHGAGIAADILTQTEAAAADVKAMDASWYAALGRFAAQGGTKSQILVLRATLNNAIQGKPVSIEVILLNGKPFTGKAWAPQLNTAMHRLAPSEMTFSGDAGKGRLGGSASIVFVPDHKAPFEGKPLSGRLTINALVSGGEVAGSFSAAGDMGKLSGSLKGTLRADSGRWTPPADLPASDISKLDPDELFRELGGPEKAQVWDGREVKVGGAALKASVVEGRFVKMHKTFEEIRGKTNIAQVFFGILRNPRDWTVRAHIYMPAAETWLGGQLIANHDRIELPKGDYPLLIRVKIGEKAPDNLSLNMHFVDSTDFVDVAGWHADVKRNRDIFERVIKYKPDGDLAKKAKAILAVRE